MRRQKRCRWRDFCIYVETRRQDTAVATSARQTMTHRQLLSGTTGEENDVKNPKTFHMDVSAKRVSEAVYRT